MAAVEASANPGDVRGVIVTTKGSGEFHLRSIPSSIPWICTVDLYCGSVPWICTVDLYILRCSCRDSTPMLSSDVGGYDFLSRFFAPWMGIPEDHVTGSAHSVLGPYWSELLGRSPPPPAAATAEEGGGMKGRDGTLMHARQCSARGGDLMVRVDARGERVVVSGDAAVVIRGTMQV